MDISNRERVAHEILDLLIQWVHKTQNTVEIVSRLGNAVLMSADEYAAWQETAHLFASTANARRLLDAYDRAHSGRTTC